MILNPKMINYKTPYFNTGLAKYSSIITYKNNIIFKFKGLVAQLGRALEEL